MIELDDLCSRLKGVRRNAKGATALCPSHDDEASSLSILVTDRGVPWPTCFAGCKVDQIAAALGLSKRDFSPNGATRKSHAPLTIKALAEAKGFDPEWLKREFHLRECERGIAIPYGDGFRERLRLDAGGGKGFMWADGDDPIAPYGRSLLPPIDQRSESVLHLVEGESDTWTMTWHLYRALGIPGATMTAKLEAADVSGWKSIVVHVEPDAGGETFETGVSERLSELGYAGCVTAIKFPPALKDANQLHRKRIGDDGAFEFEIDAMIEAGEQIDLSPDFDFELAGEANKAAGSTESPAEMVSSVPFSEDQIALDFAARYAGELHFVAKFNRWNSYDGEAWIADNTLRVYDRARVVCRETASRAKNKKAKAALTAGRTVNAVVSLARSDPRIVIPHTVLDCDPWLLNTPGSVVDLRTGQLRPNRREDLMTKLTAVAPADRADCPVWLSFLARIMERDDPEVTTALVSYLKRLCGYCLTGITTEAVIGFCHGSGANGKTTFINAIAGCMGSYARAVPAETFLASKIEQHPTTIANLMGARLVVASEIGRGRVWNESRLKELTGGDRVSARFMRQDFFEFSPIFKPLICGNHRPSIRSVDEAIKRRLHLIPFAVTIAPGERDKDLAARLRAEWHGILRWMIDGCLDWQREDLDPPEEVRAATEHYFEQADSIGRWLSECTEADRIVATSSTELFQSFKVWAEAGQEFVTSKKVFGQTLEERGFRPHRIGKDGVRGFLGLKILGKPQNSGEEETRG